MIHISRCVIAVKAFGDMVQTARLRIIRDHFIAGHNSCELRRHLDSVAPEIPIRYIVDRCRVWESHAIRGGGSTARISKSTRPQDPGGGEVQLTISRDMAVEWPVFHPTSRSVAVQSDDVEVPAMSLDAARCQVDCALPTGSDRVSVVVEELRQDSWSRAGSDVPWRGRDVVGVDCVFNLVGGPATVLLTGADGVPRLCWGGGGGCRCECAPAVLFG